MAAIMGFLPRRMERPPKPLVGITPRFSGAVVLHSLESAPPLNAQPEPVKMAMISEGVASNQRQMESSSESALRVMQLSCLGVLRVTRRIFGGGIG